MFSGYNFFVIHSTFFFARRLVHETKNHARIVKSINSVSMNSAFQGPFLVPQHDQPIMPLSPLQQRYRTLIEAMFSLGFKCGHTLDAIVDAVPSLTPEQVEITLEKGAAQGVFARTNGKCPTNSAEISPCEQDEDINIGVCLWIVSPVMLARNSATRALFTPSEHGHK